MNGKRAKLLRKKVGGYDEIQKKKEYVRAIGLRRFYENGQLKKEKFTRIEVRGVPYHAYKNLKRDYIRHNVHV